MRNLSPKSQSLEEQLQLFEDDNPKIVEAMRLFGLTMAQYQAAINSLGLPATYLSNSTVKEDPKTNEHVGQHQ
ncbi:MAG: hypothetical protein BroJett018_16680 [Chloroflexota bacterium]|nr:hypothetical protein [Chloroflexota bacterium]NOG66063.1 hypothetical protein [Chloroflexota bacterium]GIK63874.1 MAG: hypothetical protein BroJett018_16680 [Chloroflexota bacterium]